MLTHAGHSADDTLTHMALAPALGRAGAQALAHVGGNAVRKILAGRRDTDQSLLTKLADSGSPNVRARALRHLTDPDILQAAAGRGPRDAEMVAANPAADPQWLGTTLRTPGSDRCRLNAACNPTTPEADRRDVLDDADLVGRLTYVTTPTGGRVVRTHQLVANNRWLAEERALRYSREVQRAVCAMPDVARAVLDANRSRAHLWSGYALHPQLNPCDLDSSDVSRLVALGSPAVDLYLLERGDVSALDAAGLIRAPHVNRRAEPPEPHIVARLVARYGTGIRLAAGAAGHIMAGTRIASAAWAEPLVADLAQAKYQTLWHADVAAELLGDNTDAWDVFCVIVRTRNNDLDNGLAGAAETALAACS
jgi:hypothetical protein